MDSFILSQQLDGSNQLLELILLILAAFRVYLEIIGVDLGRLPLSKILRDRGREKGILKFHKAGFYFSMGYILFFAPHFLLS